MLHPTSTSNPTSESNPTFSQKNDLNRAHLSQTSTRSGDDSQNSEVCSGACAKAQSQARAMQAHA